MGGTQIALYQSTFVGVDLGRIRQGVGSPSGTTQLGTVPTSGYQSSPLTPAQAGEPPASISNLSEASKGFETTIAGQTIQIAYPYS